MPDGIFNSEHYLPERIQPDDRPTGGKTAGGIVSRRGWLKLTGAIALFGGLFGWVGSRVRLDGIYGVGVDGTPLALGAETVSPGNLPTLSPAAVGRHDGVRTGTVEDGVEAYAFETTAGQPLELEVTGDVAVAVYDAAGGLLDMVSSVADGPLAIPASASGTHVAQVAGTGTGTDPYALALTASSSATTVPVEAETAEGDDDFSPLEVRTAEAASGGEYIVAPAEGRTDLGGLPSAGRATYTIDLSADDDYVVWARANGRADGNSFYGRLDGGSWHEVRFDVDTWNWRKLGDTGGNDQGDGTTFSLSSGTHTLELACREDGCRLDKLVVTNDTEFTPTGTGPTDSLRNASDPPPVDGFENASTDPDDDGQFEDVNGDGSVNIGDVQALFVNTQDPAVRNNVAAFDFNDDGSLNILDVQALFAEIGDSTTTTDQAPFDGIARDVTDTVEAEHFDAGGEGIAYSDADASNNGGAFRPDEAVDIESRTDGYNISWLEDGEWLEYTVDVPAAGTYDVVARVASADGGGTLRVILDGTTLGTIDVPVTGGWSTWTTAPLSGVSVDAGSSRLLRLEVVDSGFELDWIVFDSSDTSSPTAAAGPDRTVTAGDDGGPVTVTLDGSESSGSDGTIIRYSWRDDGTEIATGEVADVSLATGTHEITLVVIDDDGAADIDTVTITVSDSGTVTGTLKEWHKVTLAFDGPDTSETADPNPFLDYRLDVTFEGPSGQTYEVPGYYAADGAAADSGATSGSTWHAHLAPDEAGEWSYEATFVEGDRVAVDGGGRPTVFDGAEGTFTVATTDKSGRDFRARGALQAVGDHYLQFAGSDEYFLKIGADSSENFLGYAEFDQTYAIGSRPQDGLDSFLHEYEPHVDDWTEGDPTWQDEQGKGIIGAVNYLASKGINSHYFLTYNIDGGDGSDVWPWTSPDERLRFDVSKLAQWERLFEHMTRKGVMLHVVTQETENDQGLDGGSLGTERKLYYRELIARFGHHPAITWNLGEENSNSDAQRSAFIDFFEETDPYDSFLCVHTYPGQKEGVYGDLLGRDNFDGTSLQTSYSPRGDVLEWRRKSAQAGRPWVVMVDETGSPNCGIPADGNTCIVTQDEARRDTLWGTLMAGAGGVEWFFGYQSVGGDLGLEDYRSRDQWWDYSRHAHEFLTDLPLPAMEPADDRLANAGAEAHCLVHEDDDVAVVYLHQAASFDIDLSGSTYALRWLDPATGEETDAGNVSDSGAFEISPPPFDGDAAAVLERR